MNKLKTHLTAKNFSIIILILFIASFATLIINKGFRYSELGHVTRVQLNSKDDLNKVKNIDGYIQSGKTNAYFSKDIDYAELDLEFKEKELSNYIIVDQAQSYDYIDMIERLALTAFVIMFFYLISLYVGIFRKSEVLNISLVLKFLTYQIAMLVLGNFILLGLMSIHSTFRIISFEDFGVLLIFSLWNLLITNKALIEIKDEKILDNFLLRLYKANKEIQINSILIAVLTLIPFSILMGSKFYAIGILIILAFVINYLLSQVLALVKVKTPNMPNLKKIKPVKIKKVEKVKVEAKVKSKKKKKK